jgi:uncharacterized protein YbcC (UPF0753/DUF2309 family)
MNKIIEEIIKESAKHIPHQAPLQFFVHHNTLQDFEHLHFKEALKTAGENYNAKSFMSDEEFTKAIANKRIESRDIKAIIETECHDAQAIILKNISRFEFREKRLHNLFQIPSSKSLNWHLQQKLSVKKDQLLFATLKVPSSIKLSKPKQSARIKDKILSLYDVDIDDLVNPVLIKLSAGYLDQGLALSLVPNRRLGFLKTFYNLYSGLNFAGEVWSGRLRKLCKEYGNKSAYQVVIEMLNLMNIKQEDWSDFITESLLSIKGWAGMFYQYQHHPELMPVQEIPARLEDFVAVKLMLDMVAAEYILKTKASNFTKLSSDLAFAETDNSIAEKLLQYESYMTAKLFNLQAKDFKNAQILNNWYNEVITFDDFERKYYLQLAFERRHRQNTIDALIFNQKNKITTTDTKPKYQAVFCMDEREESFRRHLEELSNNKFQTFGFAGFFGVAMQYKGLDDVKPRPLCPVNIKSETLIEEIELCKDEYDSYLNKKYKRAKLINYFRKSKESMINGLFWSFSFGLIKTIPLIGHSIFPRYTSNVTSKIKHYKITRPKTRLNIECLDLSKKKFGFKVGYTIEEMANIVFNILNSMGLKANLSQLFFVIGHGSSSLNNPHEYSYHCGATGGGRGGANARAFAAMANHVEVKKILKVKGINLDNTYFVGAYHNTCDDSIEYYDTDLIPDFLFKEFDKAQILIQQASYRDAHERCRRFVNAPKNMTEMAAKLYAEQHANDLAQPRPEYGHATNAVCVIGRRDKTKNLFLDRRAFLISYDPDNDPQGEILGNILQAAAPVGAGISLEYYFSYIDQVNYGAGTKLPHNITGLIGVMNGYCSDLRTGLVEQVIEIHEPLRLLIIVEASVEILMKIASLKKQVGQLVENEWIQLVAWDPKDGSFKRYQNGNFIPHIVETKDFPLKPSSKAHYKCQKDHLNYAIIKN